MKVVHDYEQKCEMNQETDCVLRFFGISHINDFSVLTSSLLKKVTAEDEDNLEGLTKRMKTFQVAETLKIKKEIHKVEYKLNSYNEYQERSNQALLDQIDEKFKKQNQKFEKMQEQLETLIRNSQK